MTTRIMAVIAAVFAATGLVDRASNAIPTPRPESERLANSYSLPKPLSSLLNSGDFYKWVTSATDGPVFLPPSLPGFDRKCMSDDPATEAQCESFDQLTWVIFHPAAQAKDLKFDAMSPNGVVVGFIEFDQQDGIYDEAKYNMTAGQQYKYYLVVLPDNAPQPGTGHKAAQWRMVQVTPTNAVVVSRGKFLDCQKPHTNDMSYAGFGECRHSHQEIERLSKRLRDAKTPEAKAAAKQKLYTLLATDSGFDSFAWVSCVYGCCAAEDQGS
jgi:hypothetical protein